jgi:hypothetical protein
MRATRNAPDASPAPATPARPPHLGCPACGGPMFEARGLVRCQRCQFAACVGCDGGTWSDDADPSSPPWASAG